MNNPNLNLSIQFGKAPSLSRQTPAGLSRLRDWRGDGAGPPGPGPDFGRVDSARAIRVTDRAQNKLVRCTDGTPDFDAAVSYASTSPLPTKQDTSAVFTDTRKSTVFVSQPASSTAMDAQTAFPAFASSAFSSQEQPLSKAMDGCARSTVPTTVDRPVSQPLISQTQSNGASLHSSSPSKTPSASRMELVPGQKRTATGDTKPTTGAMSTKHGAWHPARTMSAESNGSRIAEVSAQLRARLSYAAAKVEKSWQTRRGNGESMSVIENAEHSWIKPRQLHNGSPEGTTVSAPDSSRTCNLRPLNRASEIPPLSPSTRASLPPPQIPPFYMQHTPKLAPPADIVISNRDDSWRQRPNPDIVNRTSIYNPHPRHRRHYSEQEARAPALGSSKSFRSHTTVIPGTPPLGPSQPRRDPHASTPSAMSSQSPIKPRTPSQNALMEQNAIETLLFMSSPVNSGYHSNSQSRQTNIGMSLEAQIGSNMEGGGTQSSTGSNGPHPTSMRRAEFLENQPFGLEAQAGDEIDRMLDQMERDSDSDGETHLSLYDFSALGNPRLDGIGGMESWKH